MALTKKIDMLINGTELKLRHKSSDKDNLEIYTGKMTASLTNAAS